MACHLSPCCLFSLLFAIALFICICCRDVSALLIMIAKHFIILEILKIPCLEDMGWETIRLWAFLPSWQIYQRFYVNPHALFLIRSVGDDRGKCGGVLVRFKAYLASISHDGCYVPVACRGLCSPWRWRVAAPLLVASSDATAAVRIPLSAARRLLEMRGRWLRPVFPSSTMISQMMRPVDYVISYAGSGPTPQRRCGFFEPLPAEPCSAAVQ